MPWKCFIVTPTNRAYRSLRRFTWSRDGLCPANKQWGHDASVIIDQVDFAGDHWGDGTYDYRREDPRWPKTCDCGYAFKETDEWQCSRHRIFEGRCDGVLLQGALTGSAPQIAPGAMLVIDKPDNWMLMQTSRRIGPDGKLVMVRLPGRHDWWVDGPSHDNGDEGPGWNRTGVPPLLTISPSIDCPNYHSYLRNGVLEDDLAGRRYDESGRLLK